LHASFQDGKPAFGLLFDIDGVIVRGKKVLPSALESFKKLVDSKGRFRIPTVFVTNAGNALRHEKAEQLSCWLEVEVGCMNFTVYVFHIGVMDLITLCSPCEISGVHGSEYEDGSVLGYCAL
jgi:hypothetical protein